MTSTLTSAKLPFWTVVALVVIHILVFCTHSSLAMMMMMRMRMKMMTTNIRTVHNNGAAIRGSDTSSSRGIIRIPEPIWRQAAQQHQEQIYELLSPGFLDVQQKQYDNSFTKSIATQKRQSNQNDHGDDNNNNNNSSESHDDNKSVTMSALNPKHPVYNFLIEYYGLKGSKGPRRLARWSPSLNLLLQNETTEIRSLKELQVLSSSSAAASQNNNIPYTSNDVPCKNSDFTEHRAIFLEGATEHDFGKLLHLKGATIVPNNEHDEDVADISATLGDGLAFGVMYSPSEFFGKNDPSQSIREQTAKTASAFLWYKSILEATLHSEPILHCYGLHEWAMQYQPPGAPPPPSAKYQAHLPLRISRTVINDTVERKGVSCTHVDALRFFAKDALPLNQFGNDEKNGGGSLQRADQVEYEQPGCVHAHMDLLKIALKLQPFCDATLLRRVLEVALMARRLDVSASPYDASEYGVGCVPIETTEGRAEYRKEQIELMKRVQPIRKELLDAYNIFLKVAFHDDVLKLGTLQFPKLREA